MNTENMTALGKAIEISEKRYETHKSVMVSPYRSHSVKDKNLRHLKLYKDNKGLYVLIGRRSSRHKKYLKEMKDCDIIGRDLNIVIFYGE